jgi:hypothetical protein
VRVDDIDNQGKLSLSFADDVRDAEASGDGDSSGGASRGDGATRDRGNSGRGERAGGSDDVASFEEFFDSQARAEFGDLGPAEASRQGGRGGERGGDRGGERSGGSRGPRRRRR